MSIGSVYYFDYKLTSAMAEMVEAWENSLESNHDEFVVIDNEESDYGIIRYKDSNGVEMLTKVVQGGDVENTYFTEAGIQVMRKMMLDNFSDMLEAALIAGLPTAGDLKAHLPPEITVIDPTVTPLPYEIPRFALIDFAGSYYDNFKEENSDNIMFWCDADNLYLSYGAGLYHSKETWRRAFAVGAVQANRHVGGLYKLVMQFREQK